MKKWLAVLLLLSHINFSMFVPQVDEVDAIDKNGQQIEDINSLVQWIAVSCDGKAHRRSKDGDDDSARYFHLEKSGTFLWNDQFKEEKPIGVLTRNAETYPLLPFAALPLRYFEIQSPPPEA